MVGTLSRRISLFVALTDAIIGQSLEARTPMTVATFLATHARLSHSHDELNVGGADYYAGTLLRTIYDSGSKAVRANDAARNSGHPLFCLHPGPDGFPLHIEELHAFLDTIPPERRGMSMDDAMLRFAEHKFPCTTTP
jgi:hypothetical protein